jgi:hypothetical protein
MATVHGPTIPQHPTRMAHGIPQSRLSSYHSSTVSAHLPPLAVSIVQRPKLWNGKMKNRPQPNRRPQRTRFTGTNSLLGSALDSLRICSPAQNTHLNRQGSLPPPRKVCHALSLMRSTGRSSTNPSPSPPCSFCGDSKRGSLAREGPRATDSTYLRS